MRHNEIIATLQNLINRTPKQKELAEAIGSNVNLIGKRSTRNSNYSLDEIFRIEDFFNVKLVSADSQRCRYKNLSSGDEYILPEHVVPVLYRPDVYLSAGYGVQVYQEDSESMFLDKRLFYTDRGIKINPSNCEIVTVSGNSMSPEYRHGDRVIVDKSVKTFIDGHIFAFQYNGECFMKEICLLGKRVKAIPLNKEYESFWIEPNEDVVIFGRIIPRVRL